MYRAGGFSSERNGRPGPGPPSRQNSHDERNRPSSSGKGDTTALEDVAPEDTLGQDPGYDADVEVVRPYAIEEPDDDANQTPTSPRPSTPRLLDSTEHWQKELVNSLRGLYCDSDSNDSNPFARPKRGRKRKTATASVPYHGNQMASPGMKLHEVDMPQEGTCDSPKRMRRGSRKSRDGLATVHSALSPASELRARTDSSSSRFASETNAMKPKYSNQRLPAGDQMDID
jgi:hypothetical protein